MTLPSAPDETAPAEIEETPAEPAWPEVDFAELAAVNPGVIMSAGLYDTLVAWVDRHYRDRLSETDLADPQLLLECLTALDELTQILKLGSVYSFLLD